VPHTPRGAPTENLCDLPGACPGVARRVACWVVDLGRRPEAGPPPTVEAVRKHVLGAPGGHNSAVQNELWCFFSQHKSVRSLRKPLSNRRGVSPAPSADGVSLIPDLFRRLAKHR